MKKLKVIITVLLLVFSLVQVALAVESPTISDLVANPKEFNSKTGSTCIEYNLINVTDGDVVLEIFNSDGVLVRTVDGGIQSSGRDNILWDGKNGDGLPASEGNYDAKLSVSLKNDSSEYTAEFIKNWGTWGNDDGKFYYPNGVAVDSSGNVYVVDSNNSRIQKFNSNGDFITKWGTRGNGVGQFYFPTAIDVDPNGNVYVVDSYNHRIQKFDSEGHFIETWGNYGWEKGQFRYPMGIAVDSSGNIFVSDSSNHRIQKFDLNGNFITEWGSYGSEDGQFQNPRGLDLDSKGNVFVADTSNNRIQKFDLNGNYIGKWGIQGSGIGQFSALKEVAVDSNDNVYVADGGNNRIQVFDSEGKYITMWEHSFNDPAGIVIDSNGNVYVADTRNHQIQKFTLSAMAAMTISDKINVLVDNTAPESEIMIAGTKGTDDWFTSDVTVSLSALDNLSGINRIRYSLNGGVFQEGTSFSISSEGKHMISYYSIDNAGNKEEVKVASIKIDKTAPEMSIMSPEAIDYLHSEIVEIEFTAVDDVSGVKRITVFLDGQEYDGAGGIDLLYQSLNNHEIQVKSENYAGLVSIQTVNFNVVATIESLIDSINRLYEMGEIDNYDIFISLKDKLKDKSSDEVVANNLMALINQVEAQKGKEISVYFADMLINDAKYVINSISL